MKEASLQQLQQRIKKYDSEYYFPEKSDDWRLHHALGHLNKTMGAIAQYLDDVDHGRTPAKLEITEKATPDLLQYALRLANIMNIDLESQFVKRQDAIEESKKGGSRK